MSIARRRSTRASGGGWTRTSGTVTSGSSSSIPPGSGCSIQFGTGLTSAAPGTAQNLLVVSDIEAAHAELVGDGVDGSGVFHDSHRRLQPLRPWRAGGWPRSATAHLRVVRGVHRPGRQRLAAAGDHEPAARPRRPDDDRRTARSRIWRARCGARRPPTASTRPGSARRTRTGPTGTPRTWWRSSPAPSSRPEPAPEVDMSDRAELDGQTVVVIGGSAGIGLETARRAREEGADVILTARDPRPPAAGRRRARGASVAAFDATDFDRLGRVLRRAAHADRPRAGDGPRSLLRAAARVRRRAGTPRRRGPSAAADPGRSGRDEQGSPGRDPALHGRHRWPPHGAGVRAHLGAHRRDARPDRRTSRSSSRPSA